MGHRDEVVDCPHCGGTAFLAGVTRPTPVRCIHCFQCFTALPARKGAA